MDRMVPGGHAGHRRGRRVANERGLPRPSEAVRAWLRLGNCGDAVGAKHAPAALQVMATSFERCRAGAAVIGRSGRTRDAGMATSGAGSGSAGVSGLTVTGWVSM